MSKRLLLALLVIVLILAFVINVSLGSVKIPISKTLEVILGSELQNPAWQNIITEYRFPKAFTAIIAGAGLSIAGLLMQTFFRNPVAGPYILGVSSGASLGVALLILGGQSILITSLFGNFSLAIAAIVGALLVMLLVVFASTKITDITVLLILGLMFGAAVGAIVNTLQFFSHKDDLRAFVVWTFGSLGDLSWVQLKIMSALVLLAGLFSLFLSKSLNALLLGEEYAKSLGVRINQQRVVIITLTGIIAGAITAFCGPLAFVGIAVPHLARWLSKSNNHNFLLPFSALLGAVFMLLCDSIAQVPGKDISLPINVITSLIGSPIVVLVIFRYRKMKSMF